MRVRLACISALLAVCAMAPPAGAPAPIRELNGRVAQPAVNCVRLESHKMLRTPDSNRNALLYGSGSTIWLNQLAPGCTYGNNDVLVTEPFGSSLCRGDIVRSFDRLSRIPGPACVIGDFVPYNRAR